MVRADRAECRYAGGGDHAGASAGGDTAPAPAPTAQPATPPPAAQSAAPPPAASTAPPATTTAAEKDKGTKKKKPTKKMTRQQEIDRSIDSGTVPSRYRSQVPKEYQQYVPFAK